MKVAITYKSRTGNTKQIAEAMRDELKSEEIVYFGTPEREIDADVYFIGSWTDKGTCDGEITELLQVMEGKKIAFFGTAGFGGSKEYYQALSARACGVIPASNQVLGSFYCQGKMPMAVRDHYVNLLREHPEDQKLEVSVQNFDDALSHPDESDLTNAAEWARAMMQVAG